MQDVLICAYLHYLELNGMKKKISYRSMTFKLYILFSKMLCVGSRLDHYVFQITEFSQEAERKRSLFGASNHSNAE